MLKKNFVSILFLLIAALPNTVFCAEYDTNAIETDSSEWAVIESSYATIFVDRDINLRRLIKQIDVSFARYDPLERGLFLNKGLSGEEKLAYKIDIIVRKDKKILDMHTHDYHVDIRIYGSNKELWSAYENIFREKKNHRAFYIHKFRTIYISLPNVSGSILAHEIAHSIIDNYFKVLPPNKIRELLASYCDVHLSDNP